MNLLCSIKFPLSYGVFILILCFLFIDPQILKVFYPYILICSIVGIVFSIFFILNIKKYIEFQNYYEDPLLKLYSHHNTYNYYRLHLLIVITTKIILILFWPYSLSQESILISSLFLLFMYILNIIIYNLYYLE